jgi:membrane associated rhomboid family serine protease
VINFSNQKPVYFPYVSLLLSLAFISFLILTEFTGLQPKLMDFYAIHTATYWQSVQAQPMELVRLLTALFLHGNWLHWIINNSIFLLLSFSIERMIGGQKLALIFFAAGIIGNVAGSLMFQGQDNLLIGASGAVSGLIGLWLVMFPQKKINFIIPIGLYLQKTSMPLAVVILLWLVVQIILQFQPNPSYDISWISHIAGFTTGFLMAWFVK